MSVNQNNAKVIETCGQRLKALKKHVTATKATMSIAGKPMKLADVIAVYQNAVDTRTALIEERASFDKALTARDDAEVSRLAMDAGLKSWVASQFGPSSLEAQEFGFVPRRVTAPSVETKALAAKKGKATRNARGTKGKRQKALIKGTVVAPAVPAEPAVTTPAAPPAAVVPASTNGALNGAASSNGAAGSH
jgi:hypothetical protein